MKILLTVAIFAVCISLKSQTNEVAATNAVNSSNVVKKSLSPEAVEIGKVISEAQNCVNKTTIVLKNGRKLANDKKATALIEKIDTSRCPKDFRLAWEDLLFAVRERLEVKGGLTSVAEMLGGLYSANPAIAGKGVADMGRVETKTQDADAKVREAAHELKKVLIKYSPD